MFNKIVLPFLKQAVSGDTNYRGMTGKIDMMLLDEKLGCCLKAKEVANYLNIDEKTVRQYYRELGGIRLGRLYIFPEKGVLNAVLNKGKGWGEMESPSEEERKKERENIQKEEGGSGMGSQDAPGRKPMGGGDKHGLFD